jgi:hypothetical protein
MNKMYFDPDAFDHIRESIKLNPCPHRKYSLAVVDSFAMYMLLQLHVKRDWFTEQKVMLDVLRPVIAKSDDKRKNKDIAYLLNVLHNADMITFNMRGKKEVCYKIAEIIPTKLSSIGEPRKPIAIKKGNRQILEDYPSNVPFALYCLLRSIQRAEDNRPKTVTISFEEIKKRLCISFDTLVEYKAILERDMYIHTIKGVLCDTENGRRRECNEYVLFDIEHREAPEKNQAFRLRKEQGKARQGNQEQDNINNATAVMPTQEAIAILDI